MERETGACIAVLGGDRRQICMAEALKRKGYRVNVWGLGEWDSHVLCRYKDWKSAIEEAFAVVLPLPVSTDGVRIFAPLNTEAEDLRWNVLLASLSGKRLLGGKLSAELLEAAALHGVHCTDYFCDPVLELQNALLTAEGAIELAMRMLPVSLYGSEIAVIGYGRIGELITRRLFAFGASVSVYARREEVLARAVIAGARPHLLREGETPHALSCIRKDTRVVFNTVPKPLFTESILQSFPQNAILIDLASAPGGVETPAAARLGIHSVWATALPGKYAPESAGEIIADAVARLCDRKGGEARERNGDD